MRKMSNGEVGVDLEHVLFMPMEPLKILSLKLFPQQNKIKRVSSFVYIFSFLIPWFPNNYLSLHLGKNYYLFWRTNHFVGIGVSWRWEYFFVWDVRHYMMRKEKSKRTSKNTILGIPMHPPLLSSNIK